MNVTAPLPTSSTNLDKLFRPQTVAVIGATEKPGSVGETILSNLFEQGFRGQIFPVNPRYAYLHSVKCYASILEIPDAVDLAIIIVNRDAVLSIVDECAQKGVGGIVVISAGFKEVGGHGVDLEAALKEKVHQYGMRMVGPNCMGIINTDPTVSLNATFAIEQPLQGEAAFISQSGALGVAILSLARQLNLGLSYFVSMGNKADISGNDLLTYWADDPAVRIILLYLESFGNPRRFREIASQLTQKKPILVVKSGRTAAGAKAVSSHTGALAGADIAVDALMAQSGVLRMLSIEGLFEASQAFLNCPPLKGNRLAIVTNAGGPAVMATDSAISAGFRLSDLSDETRTALKAFLPDTASVRNPVDMIASASEEDYKRTVETVIQDETVDALLVIYVQVNRTFNLADFLAETMARYQKPIMGVVMAREEIYEAYLAQRGEKYPVPLYAFPESAVSSLSSLWEYHQWLQKPEGAVRQFPDFNQEQIETLLQGVRKRGEMVLTPAEATDIIASAGISLPRYATVWNQESLQGALQHLQFPLVMKVNTHKIVHKTDVGGVLLNLSSETEVLAAYQKILTLYHEQGLPEETSVLLQEMAPKGHEFVAGMTTDPAYGPMMMFGLGGIYLETLRDVQFRLAPLRDIDTQEMIQSIRSYPLLKGVRGQAGVDTSQLEEILARLSQLVLTFESYFQEIDLNPLLVSPIGVMAVDARIILKP